jgi:hypothetical protein
MHDPKMTTPLHASMQQTCMMAMHGVAMKKEEVM